MISIVRFGFYRLCIFLIKASEDVPYDEVHGSSFWHHLDPTRLSVPRLFHVIPLPFYILIFKLEQISELLPGFNMALFLSGVFPSRLIPRY